LNYAFVEECLAVGKRRGAKEQEDARLFYGCGTYSPGFYFNKQSILSLL
jgi:hypothetical protein